MIRKGGIFELVKDRSTLEKLSGVTIVNGDVMVKRAVKGEEQPGRELYKILEKDLARRRCVTSATVANNLEEKTLPTLNTLTDGNIPNESNKECTEGFLAPDVADLFDYLGSTYR